MGAASSKHDGCCLMCLFGDGYPTDAGWEQNQLRASELQQRQRAMGDVSCHRHVEDDNCGGIEFQAGSAADDNIYIRPRGEVRRIGSLQEEIDWIERESILPSTSASTLSTAYPIEDAEDLFVLSRDTGQSFRPAGKTITANNEDRAAPSADDGLRRLSPNQNVAAAVDAVCSAKRQTATWGIPRHGENQERNNPAAWPWPPTVPPTPNTNLPFCNNTASTPRGHGSSNRGEGTMVDETTESSAGASEDGLVSFFTTDRDELVEDVAWCQARSAPSLAELLGRVELLGNVEVALSEARMQQEVETEREAIIRGKVMERFLQVVGPNGPGLLVKKCHRGGRGRNGVATGRGKWADRTVHFQPASGAALPDGTPIGGAIVWNSKRHFPREQPGVDLADIVRVEHSGKFVWIKAGGEGKLGFETHCSADAKFFCRSIDFLVSATLRQSDESQNGSSNEDNPRSTGVVYGSQQPTLASSVFACSDGR